MKTFLKFILGGTVYVALECLWRGWSHISMFFAGGVCFLFLGRLRKTKLSLPVRAVAGGFLVTAVELVTGLLVNRGFDVWDYRHMRLNFLGQVCLPFTLLWMLLSVVGMGIDGFLEKTEK